MLLSSIITCILHKCVSIKTLINNEVINIKYSFNFAYHLTTPTKENFKNFLLILSKLPKEHYETLQALTFLYLNSPRTINDAFNLSRDCTVRIRSIF